MGRMALPLTQYLDQNGRYEGFDVFKSGIVWSQKNISKNFPNFNFKHVDIKKQRIQADVDVKTI